VNSVEALLHVRDEAPSFFCYYLVYLGDLILKKMLVSCSSLPIALNFIMAFFHIDIDGLPAILSQKLTIVV
jgi:hypothetical protein